MQMTETLPPLAKTHIQKHPATKGHIVIENVSVEFDGGVTAVDGANLDIKPGEFITLLGPSGCGKSTLMNCVAGFVKPTKGNVTLDGQPITSPGFDRGMVFQSHSLFPWKTVSENIMFGPLMAKKGKTEALSIARSLLEMVGLSAYENRYPGVLSGGMKQRVGIARALANYPNVLLMDEPFGALDAQTRAKMQSYLMEIWKNIDITILFITHDLDEAIYLADRILVLKAHPGEVQELIEVPVPQPRTQHQLLSPEFLATRKRLEELIHPPESDVDINEDHLNMVRMVPVDDEVNSVF